MIPELTITFPDSNLGPVVEVIHSNGMDEALVRAVARTAGANWYALFLGTSPALLDVELVITNRSPRPGHDVIGRTYRLIPRSN